MDFGMTLKIIESSIEDKSEQKKMLIVVGGEVDGPGHFWLPRSGQEPIYDLDSEFFTFIIGHDEENTKICRISFFQWEKTSNEEWL